MIDRFRQEPDGWREDVLVAGMIGLAKKTGDVTRVPIALPAMTFEQQNFWTSHFGGVYIFRDVRFPAAISTLDWKSLGEVPVPQVMDLTHRNQIADWLERNNLAEPIVQARGMDAAAVLRQKMDFILIDAADRLGIEVGDARRTELRKVAYKLGSALPEEFLGLAALLRWVEAGGPWPKITSEHPAYFYTLRGRAGKDRDLVNMLLSELAPMDVRQMFIVHKEYFYAQYATWSERKKTYVADFLAREYQVDREGARTALFGAEPGMDELHRPQMAEGPKPLPGAGRGPVAGPWGGRG